MHQLLLNVMWFAYAIKLNSTFIDCKIDHLTCGCELQRFSLISGGLSELKGLESQSGRQSNTHA